LIVLFINLSLGGLLRIRKGWRQTGILIAHSGILLLLIGGFLTYQCSTSGHMTLYEDQQAAVYKSYHEWEVVMARHEADATLREFVIPGERFAHLVGQQRARFAAGELDFDLTL